MDNEKTAHNAEERILEAAKQLFYRDGVLGARMQDIADLAQINRAMLHYYFRDKESLSQKVMQEVASKFEASFHENLDSEMSFDAKIDSYINQMIDFVSNNSDLTIFALHESLRDKDIFRKLVPDHGSKSKVFTQQLQEEIKQGRVHPFSNEEFIVFMGSLCMFPFIAGSLYKMIICYDDAQWETFSNHLKKSLPALIKQSIYTNYTPQ